MRRPAAPDDDQVGLLRRARGAGAERVRRAPRALAQVRARRARRRTAHASRRRSGALRLAVRRARSQRRAPRPRTASRRRRRRSERGQVPDAPAEFVRRAPSTATRAECVVTEPSAIPTAQLCPRVPTTASVASMRSSSARSASSDFPSTNRVSDSCNDSVKARAASAARRASSASRSPTCAMRKPAWTKRARGPRPRRRRASRPVRPSHRGRRGLGARPPNRPRRRGPARRPCRDLRRARPRPESARTRSRAAETYRAGPDDGPWRSTRSPRKGLVMTAVAHESREDDRLRTVADIVWEHRLRRHDGSPLLAAVVLATAVMPRGPITSGRASRRSASASSSGSSRPSSCARDGQ